MLNIVLFGPPGSGKGTQSAKLIDKYHLIHLSTGDILRGEIEAGTILGQEAKILMDQGTLVSDDIVITMIKNKLEKHSNAKGFIFDGFPRTTAQAQALDKLLSSKGTTLTLTLALDITNEELTKRILHRGMETGRTDDQDESTIKNRIAEYNNKTAPLRGYYSSQRKFHVVNGIGSVDEIFNALTSAINKHYHEEPMDTDVSKQAPVQTVASVNPIQKAEPIHHRNVESAVEMKIDKPAGYQNGKSVDHLIVKTKVAEKELTSDNLFVDKVIKETAPTPAAKKVIPATVKKVAKNTNVVKKAAMPLAKKPAKKVVKKAANKKAIPAKKKAVVKKVAKKGIKKAAFKKPIAKKIIKKKIAKKAVKKPTAKKPKPASKTKSVKKASNLKKAAVKKKFRK